jgi:uncharacterized protein (DUF3084 family)
MTKLETVRAFNDSGPQLQIVESVTALQQTVRLMHEDLQSLPTAVATETAQALEPLSMLRQEVKQVLEAYTQVAAVQRKTLDALTQEMARSAAQAFEQKAGKLDATISNLQNSAQNLVSTVNKAEQSLQKIHGLPDRLQRSQQSLTEASETLRQQAQRPRLWRSIVLTLSSATLAAFLVGAGMLVFAKPAPPSVVPLTQAQQQEIQAGLMLEKIWPRLNASQQRWLRMLAR